MKANGVGLGEPPRQARAEGEFVAGMGRDSFVGAVVDNCYAGRRWAGPVDFSRLVELPSETPADLPMRKKFQGFRLTFG
jgi:hypothetical protein